MGGNRRGLGFDARDAQGVPSIEREGYFAEAVTVLTRSSSGIMPLTISRSAISLSASPPAALMPAMRPNVRQRPWFVPGQMVG